MVITIANEKGGSGKSTIAINLAIKLLSFHQHILVMDTDPQRSIEAFTNIREEKFAQCENVKHFTHNNLYGNIAQSLKQSIPLYEHIIIDTRGADSVESRKAMLYADLLIIPTTPSQLDYDVLTNMFERVKEIKDVNEHLQIAIVMNKLPTNLFLTKEIVEFQNAINEANKELGSDDFKLLEHNLFDRIAYKRAIGEGLGITEYSDMKAKDEFGAFFEECLGQYLKAHKSA
ncbi:ParA family protein [Helicobacter jaachi]|uniref:ParA family protein n=1 Tax=Helicobacter jaachi TaxID=1677920 RepID=A0A4U8T762_9HELI|nr:ParA family protein [Helicobacter jaachi]TLD95385.1 ParA family protein [Helicobacter jaachi]